MNYMESLLMKNKCENMIKETLKVFLYEVLEKKNVNKIITDKQMPIGFLLLLLASRLMSYNNCYKNQS